MQLLDESQAQRAGDTAAAPQPTASAPTGRSPGVVRRNVAESERVASIAAGSILAVLGLSRRSLAGLVVAGVGGALIHRGATGRCPVYSALDVDTAAANRGRASTQVQQTFLVGRPAAELYAFWRDFTNLPRVMSHLERVEILDERRSRWTAKAPRLAGGTISWEAEITRDEPGTAIAWRSLPGARVGSVGEVRFSAAPGERGTEVRVSMDYQPPAGLIGHWVATMTGNGPAHQIREDLRAFKRLMETGEIPTTAGQSRGTCLGHGTRSAT